ncbi:MAG TPA: hypothetical protein VFV50_01280 [Bdellovibrionales bacterium]|nr:hypothetical protein [Bdellovibrionales bacterium]
MGNELLNEVVAATGLPAEWVSKELIQMLVDAGIDPAHLTLDQLRDVLALHIGEALLKAKEHAVIES